ncbi:ribonuclease HII [Methanothermobacter marburgensis]|uniref:Ribonuclease HII n=1 Tax=Methanothermobacter marburgensis (strain ATCC BAA-927 / DSM 2133 / JCM 14651 / NBRC 100331 / OCM 82 / Marburg) TaxID=79929 RepID=D9PXP4_METTM|nr:ribonuclease HII [Methanothermobacter marburgensis]ADL58992.1 ribonuclease HII [Methanothermobacter marburgensis str. Marburg]WBF09528.1 ribonuclease HII [Methanothermobacter marburgensis]
MKVLGIDEAGRGPVIGPLVVAGVMVPERKFSILRKMGIRDSKKLTPERRKFLARKIRRISRVFTVKISASDIDRMREKGFNLNEIEKIAIKRIIAEAQPDSVIIDSVDVKPERLTEEIRSHFGDIEVKAEHGADAKYYPVAAASIIAKVERDLEIERIQKRNRKLGDIGSGYPSDPRTRAFLESFSYDELPDFVRKSWATVQKRRKN